MWATAALGPPGVRAPCSRRPLGSSYRQSMGVGSIVSTGRSWAVSLPHTIRLRHCRAWGRKQAPPPSDPTPEGENSEEDEEGEGGDAEEGEEDEEDEEEEDEEEGVEGAAEETAATAVATPSTPPSRPAPAILPFQRQLMGAMRSIPAGPSAVPQDPRPQPPDQPAGALGLVVALLLAAGAREARLQAAGGVDPNMDPRKRGLPVSIAAVAPGVKPEVAPETEEERAAREAEEARQAEVLAKRREEQRRKEEAAEKKKEEERARFVAKEQGRVQKEREQREQREKERLEKIAEEERKREELNRKIREENRAKRRAEEEQRKKDEAERKARREAEEAAIKAKMEEERKARAEAERKLRKNFSVKLAGGVEVRRPRDPKATAKHPDAVEVEVSCGSTYAAVLGMAQESVTRVLPTVRDLRLAALEVAMEACAAGAKAHEGAVRMQQFQGAPSPLDHMDDAELEHWMRVARVRAQAEVEATISAGCDDLARGAGGGGTRPFDATTERSVMPPDHRLSTRSKQEELQGIFFVGNFRGGGRLLEEMVAEEEAAAPVGGLLAHVLTYAHVLDQAAVQRDEDGAQSVEEWQDKAAVFERARSVCSNALREASLVHKEENGLDALKDVASCAQSMLGPKHPCSVILRDVVETFEPKVDEDGRPLARGEDVAWPTREEIKAAVAKKKKEEQPIPEQVWALKNVAFTLSRTADTRGQARGMLEEAAMLREEFLGDADHPGLLAELEPLASVLEMQPEWAEDAAQVRARMMGIVQRAAEERASGEDPDPAGAATLLEAALDQLGPTLGGDHPAVVGMAARAEELVDQLGAEGMEVVLGARESGADIVQELSAAYDTTIDTRRVNRRDGL